MLSILTLVLLAFPLQEQNTWNILADVTYKSKVEEGYEIDYPVFGSDVTRIDGSEIELKGYMVPLENLLGSRYFMLSSLPFNNCFFCGGAGPETIVEVFTTEDVKFRDEIIVVKGTLELNESDPEHHMYMLKNATIQ